MKETNAARKYQNQRMGQTSKPNIENYSFVYHVCNTDVLKSSIFFNCPITEYGVSYTLLFFPGSMSSVTGKLQTP